MSLRSFTFYRTLEYLTISLSLSVKDTLQKYTNYYKRFNDDKLGIYVIRLPLVWRITLLIV